MIIENTNVSPVDMGGEIYKLIAPHDNGSRTIVDIGCGIDFTQSNSVGFITNGYRAFCSDVRDFAPRHQYPNVAFCQGKVTPYNICGALKACGIPKEFTFLSLDVDGYDYSVLQAIVREHSPQFIVCEINEKIPPPVCFSVLFDERWNFPGNNHCYGASLSKFAEICKIYPYSIIDLWYNNLILCHNDTLKKAGFSPVTDLARLYEDGYLKLPHKSMFWYNANMEHLLPMCHESPVAAVDEINKLFQPLVQYAGQYEVYVSPDAA